jgi:hypothetical protein
MKKIALCFLLSITFFCGSSQENSKNGQSREKKSEMIIGVRGDINTDEIKLIREKLPEINIHYVAYCVSQKCLIVEYIVSGDDPKNYNLSKMQGLMPGMFLGIKDYNLNEFAQNCGFFTKEEASVFKTRLEQ